MTSHPNFQPRSLGLRVLSVIVSCLCLAALHAAEPLKMTFDLPSAPAEQALKQFSAQSGLDVLFATDTAAKVTTNEVKGDFTPQEAINRMLAGTPLEANQDRGSGAMKVSKTSSELKNVNRAIAQDSGRPDQSAKTDLDANGEPVVKLDTFEVFEKKTLNMDIRRTRDDALPYVVFDSEKIKRSGATSVEDFIKYNLPMSNQLNNNSQYAGLGTTSSISLRGLTARETLVLVDGRRAAANLNQGIARQSDLSGIPLSAIERIEVLPSSAAGIYGGNALGGVINVILKRNYSGSETQLDYESFEGGARRQFAFNAGVTSESGKTHVSVNGSFADADGLFLGDRDFIQRGQGMLLRNNPSAIYGISSSPPLGYTTNIRSNAPLVGGVRPSLTLKSAYGGASLSSPFTFVPVGYAGPASDNGAGLLSDAGRYNLELAKTAQPGGANSSLLNLPTTKSGAVAIRQEFSPALEGFFEVRGAESKGTFRTSQINSSFTIPGTAASNPFNEDITVTVPAIGGDGASYSKTTSLTATAGLIWKISKDWKVDLDYAWSRSASSSVTTAATSLLSTTAADIASGALNVFRDTNVYPANFLPYVDQTSVSTTTPARATLRDLTLRSGGQLEFHLPGGPLAISTLLERRDETYGSSATQIRTFQLLYPRRSQAVDSAYMEVRLPVIGVSNQIPALRSLEVTLAGRYDKYRSVGTNTVSGTIGSLPTPVESVNRFSSTNPSLSLKLEPLQGLQLRGSYSTGFLPPGIDQLVPTATSINLTSLAPLGYTDPKRGNEPIGGGVPVLLIGGGNDKLKPEKSESHSWGIVATPRFAKGLRLSADWIKIEKTDAIGGPFVLGSTPTVFDYEDILPGLVTRGPASGGFPVGPVLTMNNGGLINVSRLTIEAIDFAADYEIQTQDSGSWNFSLEATHQVHNLRQITLQSPLQELAQTEASLGWRGTASAGWEYRKFRFGWSATYFDAYWLSANHAFNLSQGSAKIPSQVYHDVSAAYRLGNFGFKRVSDVELSLGIQNLFNTYPPANVGTVGLGNFYYSPFGDPRLRRFTLRLRVAL